MHSRLKLSLFLGCAYMLLYNFYNLTAQPQEYNSQTLFLPVISVEYLVIKEYKNTSKQCLKTKQEKTINS